MAHCIAESTEVTDYTDELIDRLDASDGPNENKVDLNWKTQHSPKGYTVC